MAGSYRVIFVDINADSQTFVLAQKTSAHALLPGSKRNTRRYS
jgi:hypothetical protein